MKQRTIFFAIIASIGILSAALVSTHAVFAADSVSGPVALYNPLDKTVDPDAPIQSLTALFINTIFGIAGSIALAMFVWGGVLWLTSRGDEKQVLKGKGVIQWTVLGMIMMFASYTIVNFLFSNIGTSSSGAISTGASGGSGSASGSGSGGSAATGFCCANAATKTATTVATQSACNGGGAKVYSGACDTLQFCLPNCVEAVPLAKGGQCSDGKVGVDFNTCISQILPSGAPTAPTNYYCCYQKGKKSKDNKFTQVSGASEDIASSKCGKLGYSFYLTGECTTENIKAKLP